MSRSTSERNTTTVTMNGNYTGIDEHPGRQQSFTVWVNGKVAKFAHTRGEAEVFLEEERKNK